MRPSKRLWVHLAEKQREEKKLESSASIEECCFSLFSIRVDINKFRTEKSDKNESHAHLLLLLLLWSGRQGLPPARLNASFRVV
jgi:hypothetical protein